MALLGLGSGRRELPPDVEERIEAFEEALEKRLESLTRNPDKAFWSQGPRLSERLDDLFRNVDDAFAAPTAAQEGLLEELSVEYRQATAAWNAFLADDLGALNEVLESHGVPGLAVPDAVAEGE